MLFVYFILILKNFVKYMFYLFNFNILFFIIFNNFKEYFRNILSNVDGSRR